MRMEIWILELYEGFASLTIRPRYRRQRSEILNEIKEKNIFLGERGLIHIDERQYIPSTAWEIISKEGKLSETAYECCPQVYQAGL